MGRVLGAIREMFGGATDEVEVTVECNPSSLNRERAAALREQGVNRLSVGVQSLDANRLQLLGRLHDLEGALRAINDARAEISRVNADVIFGIRGQTVTQLSKELIGVADSGVEHISAYCLTIESGTPFGKREKNGEALAAGEAECAEMFEAARNTLAKCGFEHYEVSNYARAGRQARHNLHYWRGGAYLGLGAGAVGCLPEAPGRARRYRNRPDPLSYMQNSATPQSEIFEEQLGPVEIVREGLMLGLRTAEGAHLPSLQERAGVDPFSGRRAAIDLALARGDLILQADRLQAPPERWIFLDRITAAIF